MDSTYIFLGGGLNESQTDEIKEEESYDTYERRKNTKVK